MQSANGIFKPSLEMLVRDQSKPGLLFACLFIYFKLMIFLCDNSRQFIEEGSHCRRAAGPEVRGIKPHLFPAASVVPFPQLLACSACVLNSGQAPKAERTLRTFSTARRVDVSHHSGDSPRGTAILATSPPSSEFASWYK